MRTIDLGACMAAALLAGACQPSAPPATQASALAAAVASDAEIKAILTERIDFFGAGVGMVVGVVRPGERRIITHGVMDKTSGNPPDADTVFDLASTTKAFTALVLADMVQRGEVKLDDPVAKYLPPGTPIPVQAGGRTITLIDLATFTAGLPWNPPNLAARDPENGFADYSLDLQKEFLAGFRPSEPIGSRFSYSNAGYNLLSQALSSRAGLSYEELVKQRILDPLGMKDTGVLTGQTPPPQFEGRLASGYNELNLQPTVHSDHPEGFMGSGALSSSANDMMNFLEAMIGIRKSSLDPAIASMLQVRRPTDRPDTLVGFSWGITQRDGHEIVWRSGGHPGFTSWIGYDAAAKTGVVILSNSGFSSEDIGIHLLNPHAPLKPMKKRIAVPPARLEAYAGRYKAPDGQIVTIVRKDDHLVWSVADSPSFNAFATGERHFYTTAFETDFVFDFERELDPHPRRVVFYQPGQPQPELADRMAD